MARLDIVVRMRRALPSSSFLRLFIVHVVCHQVNLPLIAHLKRVFTLSSSSHSLTLFRDNTKRAVQHGMR